MHTEPSNIPEPDRPQMPEGYGVPQTEAGILDWGFVEERMAAARNYWIVTASLEGHPQAMPVWGAWIDQALYFSSDPETLHARNLSENPQVVAHLESGDQVVIVEGIGRALGKPESSLGHRLAEAFSQKYASDGYSPDPESWDAGGMYVISPQKVFAWHEFPGSVTRWRFEKA